MLKNTKKLIIASSLITSSLLAQTELSDSQIKQMENLNIFKKSGISITKGLDADSVYILNIKAQNAVDTVYLTKDKKYLISGDVLDANNGMPLTMPVDVSILKGKEAFTFGTGSDEYILFTDPECPYCRKFESYFPQIEDKVKIRVFYYPLDFHKNAYDLSLFIMAQENAKDRLNAMLNVTAKDEEFKNHKFKSGQKEKLSKKLDENIELALQMGVQGTPAMFDLKGNKIVWVNILRKYGINVR
jgi:thiol:disulfide interchange protein DsbC